MSDYIHSRQLGMAVKSRVEWAVNCGLLANFDGDYCLTTRAMREYDNFFRWVTGSSDKLFENKNNTPEPAVQETKRTGRSMKQDEIENLFSGL